MIGIFQFYYTLKMLNDLFNYSFGTVKGTGYTQEDFLSLPHHYQWQLVETISKIK